MSRLAQCQNKMLFPSTADAKRWARQERKRSGVGRMWPYTCGVCGGIHLSSLTRREARARGYEVSS
jgi:hypothetical protein